MPGILIVLLAAIFQGSFILPMNYTRNWKWAHNWFVFSLLGMLLLNIAIGFATIPSLLAIFAATPQNTLLILSALGFGWGIGAVLFGLGMDRLGMSLGYPIIMGLIAVLGGLLPFALFHSDQLASRRGLIYFLSVLLAVAGIFVSSRAATQRDRERQTTSASNTSQNSSIAAGLVIAILAGILSCLPNLGISMSAQLTNAGAQLGVPATRAANAVWVLFFSMGFLANAIYCLYLMQKSRELPGLARHASPRNLALIFAMAAMWIASFYLYGFGVSQLGPTATIFAWPIFICVSILVGNFWGLQQGEWRTASPASRRLLYLAILFLIASVVLLTAANRT
jgi:L-rhamnose-H+ transport protein